MFAHIGPVVKQIFDRCELAQDFCGNTTEILPRGKRVAPAAAAALAAPVVC